jgi:hypothetical protein
MGWLSSSPVLSGDQGFFPKKKKKILKKKIKIKILPLNFCIFLVLTPPNYYFFNLAPQILNSSSVPAGDGAAMTQW